MITFALATFLISFVFRPIAVLMYAAEDAIQMFLGCVALICIVCRFISGFKFFSWVAIFNILLFIVLDNWGHYTTWVAVVLAAIVVMIAEIIIKKRLYRKYEYSKLLLTLI